MRELMCTNWESWSLDPSDATCAKIVINNASVSLIARLLVPICPQIIYITISNVERS